jgi:hypothetical protein
MTAVPRRMGAPWPVVPLSSAVAARRAMRARVVELNRGGVAPRLPQAGGRALLVHVVAVRGRVMSLAVKPDLLCRVVEQLAFVPDYLCRS